MNSMDREGGLLGLFRNKAVLACLTALCLACGGCASQPEDISPLDADGLIVLTIGTADTGGTMTPVGTAIAQVLSTDQLKFNISTSTGSFMNIQNLSSGEIDLGLVAGDSAYTAVYGTEDSAPTNEDLRAVAAVFSSTSNWMSPIRTGAFYVHDLKGMRIGAGPQGSASELATWAVINALRLDGDGTVLENCSLGAGTDLILSGDLYAIHGFTGAPVSGLAQLPERVPSRLLRYTQEELDLILSQNDLYYPAVIPAGTYPGQSQDVDTFGVKCLLCVDVSMDEDLVYSMTQALWESADIMGELYPAMSVLSDRDFLCEDLPIPLHDGAQRFYEEVCPELVSK